jgi:Bacterial TSP3 repeat
MLTLTAAVIAVVAAPVSVGAAAPPPPATGHAAVIAQGNVAFTDGSYQWSASSEVYDAGAPPSPAVAGSDTFFAVTDGALVAADGETPIARVAAGEAIFVRKDATTTVMPADGAAANFLRIGLGTGGDGGTGDPFAPGPGVRDVDLVRDVLDPGGTLAIADNEAAPALVVVVAGNVTVAGDPAGSADVTAATPDTFDGNLTLVNGGSEPAVVLVAVVGTLVQTTAAGPTSTGAPTNGGGGPTEPGEPDADGDGLSDADEAERGTMPNDPDSDGDGLTDGDEVHRYGTDPLSSRTDSDHLEDGLEIERGTDPLDDDTDDDGCQDSSDDNPLTGDGDCDGDTLSFDQERQLGTDPANPDTDDDGTDDDMDPNPLSPDEAAPPPPPPPSAPSESAP